MTSTSRRRASLGLAAALLAGLLTACGSDSDTAGAITLTASDSACELSSTDLPAGRVTFAIKNTGSKVTEVYVYDGTAVVAEKENIGPGTSYSLTVTLDAGDYVVACKPGMKGDGIRTPITVSGKAVGAPAAGSLTVARAVAAYRAYVQEQADALVTLVGRFAAAVEAGDVARAKAQYAASRAPWERVEPVAEAFGDLDPRVDQREADLETGESWTGWHRIEKALWVSGDLSGMTPVARRLLADVRDLSARVPGAPMTVASIGNGAKELLDEVATGKITGEEEAFSHTDLADVQANLVGARTAYRVLRPLVGDRDLRTRLDREFAAVQSALDAHRRGDGFVSYDRVGPAERRNLARAVDALSEPLSRLTAAAVT